MPRKLGLLAAGALSATGVYAILSVGILLLVAASALFVLLWRTEVSGVAYVLGGGALACLVLGVINLPYVASCDEPLVAYPGQGAVSCSESIHPAIFFVPAAAALVATVVAALKAP